MFLDAIVYLLESVIKFAEENNNKTNAIWLDIIIILGKKPINVTFVVYLFKDISWYHYDYFAPKYIDVTVVKDVVNKTLSFWQVLRKMLGIQRVKRLTSIQRHIKQQNTASKDLFLKH